MPKNVRIIERLTGKDELTGMPIYTPVDVKDLNTLNSEDYIRIWDSKEAKDALGAFCEKYAIGSVRGNIYVAGH